MIARSWVATYEAKGNMPLLGGVRSSRSSRWGSVDLASSFLATSIENNEQAGCPALGGVVPDPNPPEIFIHCGVHHQAVGCVCPGCGKTLTKQDAIEHGNANAREV